MSARVHVATASTIGPAHVARGAGNEDAALWGRGPDGTTVVAVADGHSDPRCVRADRGAHFAVAAAVEVGMIAHGEPDELMAAIAERWRELVTADSLAAPLDGDAGASPLLAYGTTLLVGRFEPDRTVLLQIGDGDVVVAGVAGAVRPMPQDGLEGASATRSLSSPAAARIARTAIVPRDDSPTVVMLSTDGLDNAYPSRAALLDAAAELWRGVRQGGPASIDAILPDWTRDAAATSGDDTTVAVAVVSPSGRHRAEATP